MKLDLSGKHNTIPDRVTLNKAQQSLNLKSKIAFFCYLFNYKYKLIIIYY